MTKLYAYILLFVNILVAVGALVIVGHLANAEHKALIERPIYGPMTLQQINDLISRQNDFDHMKACATSLGKLLDIDQQVSAEWKHRLIVEMRDFAELASCNIVLIGMGIFALKRASAQASPGEAKKLPQGVRDG
jgi:hypothetical protein